MESLFLGLVGLLNAALGVVVLVRNPNLKSSRSFALMTASVFFWCLGLILFYNSSDVEIIIVAARVFYISALWMNTFLLLFTLHYLELRKIKIMINLAVFISSVMSISILITNNFFLKTVEPLSTGGASITVDRVGYAVYVLIIIGYFVINLVSFYNSFTRSLGIDRKRLGMMLLAFAIAGMFASYFNVALPYIGNYSLIWLGPMFTAVFVGLFSYAILKLRLFDVRLVVAKTIGYLGTLVVIAVVPILFLTLYIDNNLSIIAPAVRAIIFVTAYVIALILFVPLKKKFDSATSKLFYQDSYDLDVQINKVSTISVTEFDIDVLSIKSGAVIVDSIKPSTGNLILLDSKGEYYSDYTLQKSAKIRPANLLKYLTDQKDQVFLVDSYDPSLGSKLDVAEEAFITNLKSNNIDMSVQLRTKGEIVGFMLFGPKLSGSLYSSQDVKFITIVANELAIAIQNARRFDEIKRFNETLKLEVDRATNELRASNEKLQALDQAKDEFVSMASHQLRTPLTSVKGYLSMVLEGDVGKVDPKQRDMLSAAFTSSQRMVYLIADLLNVSRLQTGKFVIDPGITYLPDVIETEMEQLNETAKSKKLKLTFNKPKNYPKVYLDETKTRQVIMNFIDNAIYYTPQDGKIEIVLEADDKKITFKVTDNGIGVPRMEQRNMFTKFYRASNAKKARPDGTGLGLFMAKKVIIDQGGAVIFDSAEGEGSTFGFTFPLTRVRPPKELTTEDKPISDKKAKKSGAVTKKSNRKKSKKSR